MVGPKIGQFDGGLASPVDSQCMKDVEVGGWRYTDGSAWFKHSQLRVTCQEQEESKISKTGVNAKFKITSLTWDQELRDPEPEKYHELANTVEDNINDLLKSDKDRADFTDSVEHFKNQIPNSN